MFKKYSSIENGYRKKYVEIVKEHPEFNDVLWQVTSKIDGSHYSFCVNAETLQVRPGKRSGLTDGGFYNSQEVFDRYKEAAVAITKEIILSTDAVILAVQVEGELFGDGVQNRVKYGPKDYVAYDIQVICTLNDGQCSYYMAPKKVVELCDTFNMPHAPIIEEAVSFDKAMDVNPKFVSLISSQPIPENWEEGIVLKPTKPLTLGNGSRVIIKNKNEAFSEKRVKKVKPEVTWSDEMNQVYATMIEFNTENRIRSALSKMGKVTQKDFGKLLGVVVKDLLDDWVKEYSYGTLEKSEQKVLTKQLNRDVGDLIRSNFLNIIDGTY